VGEQRDAEKKEVRMRQRETLNKNRAFMEQQAADMNKMVAIGHGHGGGMVAGRDSRHRKKIKLG
jgi:hypothetical protein